MRLSVTAEDSWPVGGGTKQTSACTLQDSTVTPDPVWRNMCDPSTSHWVLIILIYTGTFFIPSDAAQ